MRENEIAKIVVNEALRLHVELGPGLLESVYEVLLAHMLREQGLAVQRQCSISIHFQGKHFEEGFRADLIVENLVLLEIKSVEALHRAHKKQVLTYLRLTGMKLGLLINFGGEQMRGNVERLVNRLE